MMPARRSDIALVLAALLIVVAAMVVLAAAGCTSVATSSFPPSAATVTPRGGASVAPVTATPATSLVSPLASAPAPLKVSDPKKVTGTLAGKHCAFRGTPPYQLPDASCTPGAYDPAVTAAVLCAPGYTTRSYRPPVYQTTRFKFEQAYPAYGLPEEPVPPPPVEVIVSELDHLIPLVLGGSNDASNLWPQQPAPGRPAVPNVKDRTEVALRTWVCQASGGTREGRLASARQEIAADWITALDALNVPQHDIPSVPAPAGSAAGA